jgi:hypothetical protein
MKPISAAASLIYLSTGSVCAHQRRGRTCRGAKKLEKHSNIAKSQRIQCEGGMIVGYFKQYNIGMGNGEIQEGHLLLAKASGVGSGDSPREDRVVWLVHE